MMKHEFEALAGVVVSQEDYNIIERVYTFYPKISHKLDVVKLYNQFGMVIFRDLLTRAERLAELEFERQRLKTELNLVERRIHDAENGEE